MLYISGFADDIMFSHNSIIAHNTAGMTVEICNHCSVHDNDDRK